MEALKMLQSLSGASNKNNGADPVGNSLPCAASRTVTPATDCSDGSSRFAALNALNSVDTTSNAMAQAVWRRRMFTLQQQQQQQQAHTHWPSPMLHLLPSAQRAQIILAHQQQQQALLWERQHRMHFQNHYRQHQALMQTFHRSILQADQQRRQSLESISQDSNTHAAQTVAAASESAEDAARAMEPPALSPVQDASNPPEVNAGVQRATERTENAIDEEESLDKDTNTNQKHSPTEQGNALSTTKEEGTTNLEETNTEQNTPKKIIPAQSEDGPFTPSSHKKRSSPSPEAEPACKKRMVLLEVQPTPTRPTNARNAKVTASNKDTHLLLDKENPKDYHRSRGSLLRGKSNQSDDSNDGNNLVDQALLESIATKLEEASNENQPNLQDPEEEMASLASSEESAEDTTTDTNKKGSKKEKFKEAGDLSVVPVLLSATNNPPVKKAILQAYDDWQASQENSKSSLLKLEEAKQAWLEAHSAHKQQAATQQEKHEALQKLLQKHHKPDRRTKRQKRLPMRYYS